MHFLIYIQMSISAAGLVFVLSQRLHFQLIAETVKYDGYLQNYEKKKSKCKIT